MKITIVTVGKMKEKYWRDAAAEYEKRLSKYCRLQILEVEDEKTPEKASPLLAEQILKREGERILKQIKDDAYVITLEICGERMNSQAFAESIRQSAIRGRSHLFMIIGGSLGLHPSISERADLKISFSDMTFPHQMMRVILLEQIYRSYRIIHNEPYHK